MTVSGTPGSVESGRRQESIRERAGQLAASGRGRIPDVILLTNLPDIRWATGFTGSNAVVLLGSEATHVLTDGRYTEQVRTEVAGAQAHIVSGNLLGHAAETLIPANAVVGIQPEHLALSQMDALEGASLGRSLKWCPVPDLLPPLRARKTQDEVNAIAAAQRITESVFLGLPEIIVEGMSELDLAAEITYGHLRAGAERMSFDPIVAFGENAALPHGRPTARALRNGDPILIDMGCFLAGYASDMTRMLSFGGARQDFLAAFDVVLDALNRAADAARSGIAASALDAVARGIIDTAGLGEAFSHSLGHGVGLEIHETPSVSYRTDAVLPEGAVITLEPGVYLPGQFGIRIEDMVRLRPDGNDSITAIPRDLVVL